MTRYVVVTRKDTIPIDRFVTIEAAADYINREHAFDRWTVLAQEGRATAGTPYRKLRPTEARALEAKLFPGLFE